MVSRADAVRRETVIATKRARRRRRPSLAALRVAELNRLFRARYGDTLPNDDAGGDDLAVMAHHLAALPGNAEQRITEWCKLRAPWVAIADLDELIADTLRRPRRWRADRLAWRLRLTEADRKALRITTIGAIDRNQGARAALRREAKRIAKEHARRARGIQPRSQYEATSKSRNQPWKAAGVSRRTWYRRHRSAPLP